MTKENEDQKVSNEETKETNQEGTKETNQPELTGDEETVKKEKADHKANKVDKDDAEMKSPLNGEKAE